MQNGIVSRQRKDKILAGIRVLIDKDSEDPLSLADVARMSGVNRSIVSELMKDKYSGNADKHLERLEVFIRRLEYKTATPSGIYVPTLIGDQIDLVCNMAIRMPCIGIVKTPSGWGKTSALMAKAAEQTEDHCTYIQAGQVIRTPKAILTELAVRLGVSMGPNSHQDKLYRDVKNALVAAYRGGRNPSHLIIIDEATTLSPQTINTLRNLHDEPTCKPAIVLADTVARMDSFLHSRSREAMAGGNEQLRRRAKAQFIKTVADEIERGDVAAVTDAYLKQLGHNRRLNVSSYTYLHELANMPGALGNVTARLQAINVYTKAAGYVPSYTVDQLDYIGSLTGGHQRDEWDSKPIPFREAEAA